MVMVRDRTADDLEPSLAMLTVVHAADGYPMHWPDDPYRWLTPRGFRQAWVALDGGGAIVGHVLVRDDRHGDQSAAELGRLFVHPAARREGIAVRLLARCREWAATHGRGLVLEVAASGRNPAMSLYEATGWRHTGTDLAEWTGPAGELVRLHHYRLDATG
jgi:GNAT superfamily N-acetyltransferase